MFWGGGLPTTEGTYGEKPEGDAGNGVKPIADHGYFGEIVQHLPENAQGIGV
jgi:hypothetical protein